jgi:uncharacterized protein YutE (UPF0331/DUF86 family)
MGYMVDQAKVQRLIERLREYTAMLREIAGGDRAEFLADKIQIGAARYYLVAVAEASIDLAHHLISSYGWRVPQDYRDSFAVLYESHVLSHDLTCGLQDLAGLRNRVVHVYWDVDDGRIFDDLQVGLDDLDAYVRQILGFIS